MDNNRQYPRAPLSGTVKFFEWDRPFQASATEISANGIFVSTEASVAEGSLLTLRVAIPGLQRAFTVLGKVVRTVRGGNFFKRAGLGITFLDIAAGDRRFILDYVAQRTLRAV